MKLALLLAPTLSCSAAFFDGLQIPLAPGRSSIPPTDRRLGERTFELRHILHIGGSEFPELLRRLDVQPESPVAISSDDGQTFEGVPHYPARSRSALMQRLADRTPAAIKDVLTKGSTSVEQWTLDNVQEPDIADKQTVLSLARMANDAYYAAPGKGQWQDVGNGYNYTDDYGWEADGLRGHVFADTNNKTVIISMKGTSLPFVDPRGSISNDKLNDNLLFSCCCGQGGRWLWHQVCSCQTDYHVGNSTCLTEEIRRKTRYYHLALHIYHNVTETYPESDVWMVGHSLGGSVASLVGYTVGAPAVTFEAAAEAMAAYRLGLPTPPGFRLGNNTEDMEVWKSGTYHFGHTADDIYMGRCNAWNSVCTLGGYAMEAKCHTGSICTYDTVADKGWAPNARSNHGIGLVIKDVIDTYDEPAKCTQQTKCRDCEDWTYFEDG